MCATSLKSYALLIDSLSFRRASIANFFMEWALSENLDLSSATPEDAYKKLRGEACCKLVIFSIGACLVSDPIITAAICVISTLAPDAPIVLLADAASSGGLAAALQLGIKGYLPNTIDPGLALQTVSFILRGGRYFPPETIHNSNSPLPPPGGGGPSSAARSEASSTESDRTLPSKMNGAEGGTSSEFSDGCGDLNSGTNGAPASTASSYCHDTTPPLETPIHKNRRFAILGRLSQRQCAILECLRIGDANKVIGRKLGLPESTVKVHVREIMRKLGVVNRTQIAVAVGEMITFGDLVSEIGSERAVQIGRPQ
jgi:DNA-binding NarL/FixJ family response regulator